MKYNSHCRCFVTRGLDSMIYAISTRQSKSDKNITLSRKYCKSPSVWFYDRCYKWGKKNLTSSSRSRIDIRFYFFVRFCLSVWKLNCCDILKWGGRSPWFHIERNGCDCGNTNAVNKGINECWSEYGYFYARIEKKIKIWTWNEVAFLDTKDSFIS